MPITQRILFCVGLAACGSDTPAPQLVDAPPPEVDAPDVCTTLAAGNREVVEQFAAEAAPAPAGGTFVPGTYVLTDAVVYTGVGGATGETGHHLFVTTVNDATHYEFSQIDLMNGRTTPMLLAGTYQVTGDQLALDDDCSGNSGVFGLTATPTSFTTFNVDNGVVHSLVFTRQ